MTWTRHPIEGLEPIELRSIHAWSANEVVVATAGTPCRIYRSSDAGQSWQRVAESEHPNAFIDGLRFWNEDDGFVFGDPLDGRLMSWISRDAGHSWQPTSDNPFPMRDQEAGFAASNSSLLVFGNRSVWIGLGGTVGFAHVITSDDAGTTWKRREVAPIPSSKSAGIFSMARSAEGKTIVVGGDYLKPDASIGNIAILDPDGEHWREPTGNRPRGYRSSIAYVSKPIAISVAVLDSKDHFQRVDLRWIAVGPTGTDGSVDGEDWVPLSDEPFHALSVGLDNSIWASGADGRIAVATENNR
jgi:hypothetical protein